MRTCSKDRIVCFASFLGIVVAMVSPSRGTELPPDATAKCPEFANIQQRYDEPKTPAVKEALERCLSDLSKAQQELRTLYAEGNVKRHRDMAGIWEVYLKLADGSISLGFPSDTGPLGQVDRRVTAVSPGDLAENGYRILFDHRGNIMTYVGYLPRNNHASLAFYPNGGLKRFSRDNIDRHTKAQASWDADGKLQGEGVSNRLPQDAKGLPELEDALRHGDEKTRWEATQTMVGIGSASIPYALNVLKDGDERSKCLAVSALQQLGKAAAPTVPILVRCLREDKSIDVRNSIAVCLGAMGVSAEAAIPALEEAATNDIPAVATAAKTSLGFIRESLRK